MKAIPTSANILLMIRITKLRCDDDNDIDNVKVKDDKKMQMTVMVILMRMEMMSMMKILGDLWLLLCLK